MNGSGGYAGDQANFAGHQVQKLNEILGKQILAELTEVKRQLLYNNALLMYQNGLITREQCLGLLAENQEHANGRK